MTTNPTNSPASPHRRLRWWPALVVLGAAAFLLLRVWLPESDNTQMQVMRSIPIVFFALVLLIAWLLLFSRLAGRFRLQLLGGLILATVLAAALLRVEGVNGNLVPVLGWRFAGEPALEQGRGAAPNAEVGAVTDFPQFLGPQRNGEVEGPRLASDWQAKPPKELWRRPVGAAWSSFAVAGQIAITQEQRGDQELITAYDLLTGDLLWSHGETARYATTIGGAGPRATPTLAAGRAYAMGATGLLSAVELTTGKLLWRRDVLSDNEASNLEWGKACSPLVIDELVVVSAGGTNGRSLVAYHREDGELAWSAGDQPSSYSSPLVADLAGRRQIVIFNQGSATGHDPTDGTVLWNHPWSSQQPNVSQPLVVGDNRLLLSSGYGIGSALLEIQPGSEGQELAVRELWTSPRLKAKFSNSVLHQGFVYGLDDGVLTCIDLADGKRRWKGGRYGHGQLLLSGDLLLIQSEKGYVVVVEANPDEHRELARLDALADKTWNPPALSGPYLLVRNASEAVCYELPLPR